MSHYVSYFPVKCQFPLLLWVRFGATAILKKSQELLHNLGKRKGRNLLIFKNGYILFYSLEPFPIRQRPDLENFSVKKK